MLDTLTHNVVPLLEVLFPEQIKFKMICGFNQTELLHTIRYGNQISVTGTGIVINTFK